MNAGRPTPLTRASLLAALSLLGGSGCVSAARDAAASVASPRLALRAVAPLEAAAPVAEPGASSSARPAEELATAEDEELPLEPTFPIDVAPSTVLPELAERAHADDGAEEAEEAGAAGPDPELAPEELPPGVKPASIAHPSLPPATASDSIPDGAGCLKRLDALGLDYRRLDELRGVTTPVAVSGPIGGLTWVSSPGAPLRADCRLVVALAGLGEALRGLGVESVRYSGAYSYRMSRVGRLSLHSFGLAVDVHGFIVRGRWLSVTQDFARGLDSDCLAGAPVLNAIACALRRSGGFREMLTPDYNADHHDHFHLGVMPLRDGKPLTFAQLPRVPQRPALSAAVRAKEAHPQGAREPTPPSPVAQPHAIAPTRPKPTASAPSKPAPATETKGPAGAPPQPTATSRPATAAVTQPKGPAGTSSKAKRAAAPPRAPMTPPAQPATADAPAKASPPAPPTQPATADAPAKASSPAPPQRASASPARKQRAQATKPNAPSPPPADAPPAQATKAAAPAQAADTSPPKATKAAPPKATKTAPPTKGPTSKTAARRSPPSKPSARERRASTKRSSAR